MAALVDAADVAGAQPALPQHLGSTLRIVPVALHDLRPPHPDLAALPHRAQTLGLLRVHALALLPRDQVPYDGGFGHPIAIGDGDAQLLTGLAADVPGQRSPATIDVAKRGEIVAARDGGLHQVDDDGCGAI